MNVFDLFATLSVDSSEYDKGLDDAKEKGKGLGSALSTAMKVGGAAIAAAGTAAVALGTSLVKSTGAVAAYGDNIDKMSQKMGLSAEAYQEWDAVMRHSGTSIESLQSSMKTLANAVETGNDAFETLGMTQEQIASMSNEELFSATITALQQVDNETQRTYLAGKLLGRGATELGALLNTSAEDTQAMKDRVHELGGVMSDEAVKAAAAYQDSLQDMQTAFGGLKTNMMSEFLPGMTTVMDGLGELFSGGDGMAQISNGINMLVGKFAEAIPRMMQVGSQIVMSLLQAITANLPTLLGAAGDAVLTITGGVISMLPELVQAGFGVITTLAQSIGDALPELIPASVEAILQIVATLTDPSNVGNMVDAAVAIITGLAEGLIAALPTLIQQAPVIIANLVTAIVQNVPKLLTAAFEIIGQLVTGLIDNLPEIGKAAGEIIATLLSGLAEIWADMLEVGQNIVEGIWEGIKGMGNWLWEQISGFFGGLIDGICEFLGIHSPSTLFADRVGKNMALGIGVGFDKTMDKVAADMQSAIPTPEIGDYSVSGVAGMNTYGGGENGAGRMTIGFAPDLEGLVQFLHPYFVEEDARLGVGMVT